jgi:rubrerythrin
VQMTIYEFGMQMEKDGEMYYRELARKTKDVGLRNILNLLAEDEVKHYSTLESFLKEEKSDFIDSGVLQGAKTIFQQFKDPAGEWHLEEDQVDLYEKAQGLEQQSADFYLSKANEVSDPHQKEVFLKLAEEEKKHFFLLENMIAFISRPKSWMENAEFNHLDEY